jgi:hypothetical protein
VNRLLEAADLSTNALGGAVTPSGLTPYDLCGGEAPQPPTCLPGESDSRQPHTTPSFLAPSKRGLSQLRLGWNALTASWRNELPAGSGDLRDFSTLQFRASVNFADARNPVGIAQDLTITLEDGTGEFETALVSDFSRALFYPPGEVGPVPKVILNAVRIPLSAFAGLDLADIRAIQFDFDQKSQGALLLSDVAFSNAAAGLDHFLLYAVDDDDDRLEPVLILADQFESAIHKVDEVKRLGNPVDKDGEGISDADTHLVAYEIDDGDPEHEQRVLRVANQFGELLLETDDPEWLLVPSLKSLDGPIPDDILPDPFPVDHFKCYEVELSKGAKFKRIEVPLQDQFMQEPKQFLVVKPAHLCNPVDKAGEGIENEDGHLVCYGLGRVRHKSVRNIHVNNQFGPPELETERERELCVPSTKEILGFVDDDDDNHDDRR